MRCNDCNRFVSFDDDCEPEVTNESVDGDMISISVQHFRNCSECSTELQEYTYEFEIQIDDEICQKHSGDGHELSVETEFAVNPVLCKRKTWFEIEGTASLKCECQDDDIRSYELEDAVAASDYEDV